MLTPSPTPSLLLELRQLLETDYAVPDLWDPDKQVLLDNDAYLHAQVEAIKAGSALAPGSVTDVAIGARGILDTHSAPPSGAYDDTLTNHLRTLATRVRAIMGTASWSNALPTTLTGAKAHADATGGVHGATSAATANALVLRDASGRAKFAAPADATDVARKSEVDAVSALVGSHAHDDRYYTKTQLAAAGSYGTNPIHADRVSLGTLQDARIPNLNASKTVAGTFAVARLPVYGGTVQSNGTLTAASAGWTASRLNAGQYAISAPTDAPSLASLPHVVCTAGAHASRAVTVYGSLWTPSSRQVYVKTWNTVTGAVADTGFTFLALARA